MRGRPNADLILTVAERQQPQACTRRRKTAQGLALPSRIVLAYSKGLDYRVVAHELAVTPQTVSKWRGHFVRERLGGLCYAPRSGAPPRMVQDADVVAVTTRTLEAKPRDATHWSTRAMAKQTGLSQSPFSPIRRAFGQRPHRQELFKLASDPLFVASTPDIVGLYLDPPMKAMVLCVDKKARFRRSTGRSRSCPWPRRWSNGACMTTCAMA